jgi:hypothetical protein
MDEKWTPIFYTHPQGALTRSGGAKEQAMRKVSILLVGLLVCVLVFVQGVPVAASTPTDASGTLRYIPYPAGEPKVAGGNTFLKTVEDSWWDGSFAGYSFDECNVVIHRSGSWAYNAVAYFEGSVQGQTGRLTLRLSGSRPDAFSDWTGMWVILTGTEGLANLHGQGIFYGPGSPGFGEIGEITYEGQIHFDPAD